MLVRFLLAAVLVVVIGTVSLIWLIRTHTDRIVLTHANELSEQLLRTAYASPHLAAVFEGDPSKYLFFGPFAQPDTAPQLVKFILLDFHGNFLIAKDVRTHEVIQTPRGVHTADHLRSGYERAVAGTSAAERVEYTPINANPGQYAQSMHVINDAAGDRIGGILFLMDVSDLDDAYNNGLTVFAAVLAALAFALFGVPAAAFAVQRAYASQSQKDARYLARHDPLTGLLNRRAFMDQVATAAEQGELIGVAYIDVDRFKAVNDSFGHAAGDTVLATLANTMRKVFAKKALLARLGGDEFVIAIAQSSDAMDDEAAQNALNRLRKVFAKASLRAGVGVPVSLSIGYSACDEGRSVEDTLAQADMALYSVKTGGRDAVAVYCDQMGEALKRRSYVEQLVRTGLGEDRFILHYQPLIEVASDRVVGYEALLRLIGHDGDIVPPDEFVPIAENLGVISDVGAWVIRTATKEIAGLEGSPSVAINLSVEQFKVGNLIKTVTDALESADLPAKRLELEITESMLIEDQYGVAMTIDTLRELGVSIAMDDFGTGFSSLSYLWKYGFDRIKIDRSFVKALKENPERSTELIDSIILLGNRLGMKVTAEGVEEEEQAHILSMLGCNHLQGYLYGRPQPLLSNETHLEAKKSRAS